jgi:hypothetical protein
MKQAQDVLDSIYKFTQTQKNSIDVLAAELIALKDKRIGLDTLNTLTNCFRELDGLRENIKIIEIQLAKAGIRLANLLNSIFNPL